MKVRWQEKALKKRLAKMDVDDDPSSAPVALSESDAEFVHVTPVDDETLERIWDPPVDAEHLEQPWQLVDTAGNGPLGLLEPDLTGILDDGAQQVQMSDAASLPDAHGLDRPTKQRRFQVADVSSAKDLRIAASSFSEQLVPVPEYVFNEAFRTCDVKAVKYPWEKGPLGKFFNPQKPGGELPRVKPRPDSLLQVQLEVGDNQRFDAKISLNAPIKDRTLYLKAVKVMQGSSYVVERDARRTLAINGWVELLMLNLNASSAGVASMNECGKMGVQSYMGEMLDACFGIKSPNTLLKRFHSIKMFNHWIYHESAEFWLPLSEQKVWKYLLHLKKSNGAPTRATSFLEAVRFVHFILGVEGALDTLSSARVKGLAAQLFAAKRPWRPSDPLTTEQVLALHSMLDSEDANLVDRVFCGHLLHMVYSRSRFSDLLAVERLFLDSDGMFLEAEAKLHKGSRSADTRARLLPIVAPAHGINEGNWAKTYLRIRKMACLPNPEEDAAPMLPAPTKTGETEWSERYLSSAELNSFIALFFSERGLLRDGAKLSSHSMKATGLSWAAKFGVCAETRAILARHASSTKDPESLYSRDIVSAAVRTFSDVLTKIRLTWFKPDRTRSGMITPPPGTPVFPQGMAFAPGMFDANVEVAAVAPSTPAVAMPSAEAETSDGNANEALAGEDIHSPSPPMESTEVQQVKSEPEVSGAFLDGEVVTVKDDFDLLADWPIEASSESDTYSESDSSSSQEDEKEVDVGESLQLRDPVVPSSRYFINHRSLVLHCLKTACTFKCGRQCSDSYTVVAELNGLKCGKCFTD